MWWKAAIIVLAIAVAVLPIPRPLIESVYSVRVFPPLQVALTSLSNRFSFALFDVLVAVVASCWLLLTLRDCARVKQIGWLKTTVRIVARTATIAAASYVVFLVAWGFNYRRVGLVEKLQFDAGRVSTDAAVALAHQAVDRLNGLHDAAHRNGWPPPDVVDPALSDAFSRAVRELRLSGRTVPARPKQTLLDVYFRKAGVAGMTDPFFLETLIASDLLPFERPFVVAHEWSHLAGVADEGDANFAGWLACLRGTVSDQYSGWLFLYSEVIGALDREEGREVGRRLAGGPRADLQAIRDRYLQHVNPQVSAAGWRVYDRYLKANQIKQGAASYAEVVRLILGTRFSEDGVPQLR